jgi:hypothetical protein
MMDFEIWKHRHEEMVREAERNSLARSLRRSRKLLRTMRQVG